MTTVAGTNVFGHRNNHDKESFKIWKLYKIVNGEKVFLGDFHSPDGQDCFGDEMYEWMEEEGHYGGFSPDDFNYDGDREYVAIMGKTDKQPDFCFEWVD